MRARTSALAAITTAVAAVAAAAFFFPHPLLLAALPVTLVPWLLFTLDTGYLLGRDLLHRRRRRLSLREREERRPDPQVRRPTDFPGVLELTPALRRALGDPVGLQGRLRSKGVRLAAIPFLAVVMVSVPVVFLPEGGDVAAGFVAAGCAALLAMLTLVWSDRLPTRAWVTSRMRRELFRREMYLVLVQAGPYLYVSDEEARRIRDARIGTLTCSEGTALLRFAEPVEHGSRAELRWIDALWRAGRGNPDPDLAERMRTYLEYRIRRQILFLELGSKKFERTERAFGTTVKITVLAGFTVAVVHGTRLATTPHTDTAATATLALLAATIPALCNGVISLQNLFAPQRLALSYRDTHHELVRHENALCELLAASSAPDADVRFRALALHVEAALGQELLRWRTLIDRPEFDPAL